MLWSIVAKSCLDFGALELQVHIVWHLILQSEKTEKDRIGKLLDLLGKGGVHTMDKFIHALHSARQGHVAKDCLRQPRKNDNWNEGELFKS